MTRDPKHVGRLEGYGLLFMLVAVLGGTALVLRRCFPDALPWHLLRGIRPPVQPWQYWTLLGGTFLIGLRMFVLGQRARRDVPASSDHDSQ